MGQIFSGNPIIPDCIASGREDRELLCRKGVILTPSTTNQTNDGLEKKPHEGSTYILRKTVSTSCDYLRTLPLRQIIIHARYPNKLDQQVTSCGFNIVGYHITNTSLYIFHKLRILLQLPVTLGPLHLIVAKSFPKEDSGRAAQRKGVFKSGMFYFCQNFTNLALILR